MKILLTSFKKFPEIENPSMEEKLASDSILN